MDDTEIKYFVEAALLAAGRPLSIQQLQDLFDGRSTPDKSTIRNAISSLEEDYTHRGLTIGEVASGFRMQIKSGMAERLNKLWEERPPRYSRALFETLALVAYRQPITRGEIEEVRGVAVTSNIIRTLMEREWIRVVGHRDVPGRPAMFGTTRQFLDYFGLKKLDDLPPLADLSDWESLRVQLDLPAVDDQDDFDESAVESAEVHKIPILKSANDADEDGEGEPALDAASLADAEALADSKFEEIIASEWPDAAESAADGEAEDARDARDAPGFRESAPSDDGDAGDDVDADESIGRRA